MRSRQLAHLAFKLMGILAIIQAVRLVPGLLSSIMWVGAEDDSVNVTLVVLAYALPIALLLIGGCVLIVKSRAFARLTIGGDSEPEGTATAADVHSIVLSSVGLLLVGIAIAALPYVLHGLAVLYSEFASQIPASQRSALSDNRIRLGGIILQMGLGLYLVFNSSAVVHLLRRRIDRSKVVAADGQCPHCGYWFEAGAYRPDAAAYLCSNCKQEIPRELVPPTPDGAEPE